MSKFRVQDRVLVMKESPCATRRTPHYVRGKTGTIIEVHGKVQGHEHDHPDDWGPLYSVIFETIELFGYPSNEKIVLDLHESWLEEARQHVN